MLTDADGVSINLDKKLFSCVMFRWRRLTVERTAPNIHLLTAWVHWFKISSWVYSPATTLHAMPNTDRHVHRLPNLVRNHLLTMLPDEEWARWGPHLEVVPLALGDVLFESGKRMPHVHFPLDAIVSLLHLTESGASAEIAVVGNEGVVGIAIFLGGGSSTYRAVVQSAGQAVRIPAAFIAEEFSRSGDVLRLMLRFIQALIAQTSQTVVCNRHHTVDQQLCRWLLLSLDRLEGNVLTMTHELIAGMLGVRREGVTEAALKLQSAGLISYSRGSIAVLNRPGLEHRSCECYRVVKGEYDRLFPGQEKGGRRVTAHSRSMVQTAVGAQSM